MTKGRESGNIDELSRGEGKKAPKKPSKNKNSKKIKKILKKFEKMLDKVI